MSSTLKFVAAGIAVLVLFGSFSFAARAQTPTVGPDVATRTASLLEVMGRGSKAADQFTDSAVLEGFGFCPGARCVGRDSIRQALDAAAGDKAALMAMAPVQGSGSRATGQVHVLSDSILRGGAQRLVYQFEVEYQGPLVSRMTLTPLLSDSQTAAFLGTAPPASVAPRLAPPAAGDGGLLTAMPPVRP